jgi:methionine-rich copper-binding protein CopC
MVEPGLFQATVLPTSHSNHPEGGIKMRRRSSLFLRGWLLAATLWVGAGLAWAHAIIVESTPGINDVVSGPVLEIKLRFNVRIDGARSKLTLILPDGTSRAVDLPQQASPDSISATVPQILPGNYHLHWQVLAGDGHITQGDIPFSVATR